jgi:flagellar basal body-associated protein FliL
VDPPAGYAAAPVNSSGNEGIHPGIIAIIVLIVVAVIGSFGYVVYRKKKSLSTPMVSGKHVQPSSELALDADGGVLKESMNSMSVNGGSRHDDVERSGSGEATVEETADETAPEPLEDIKISDSNDDGTAPEII